MPTKELREYARRLAKKKGIKKETPLKVLDKIREDNGGKSMKKRYRVFVDTNILISGIFFSGNEEKLIELSEQGKLILVVSDFILEEIKINFRAPLTTQKHPRNLYHSH